MMFVLMRPTNRRDLMGAAVNGLGANVLGWTTTTAASLAAAALIGTWIW